MNESIMQQAGFTAEVNLVKEGKCPFCKNPGPHTFKDALSAKEFRISGLCQACQDEVFGVDDESN